MWHEKLLAKVCQEMLSLSKIPSQESEMQRILHEEMIKLSPQERWEYARYLGASVHCWQQEHDISYKPMIMGMHLQDMLDDGITQQINALSKEQISVIHAALHKEPVYGSHVWRLSDKIKYTKEEAAQKFTQCCYKLDTIAKIPELINLAMRDDILTIVYRHLGCVPMVYQMNLMWTFPNKDKPLQTQEWHRDYDGFRFVTMLVYLSDVDENRGPHCYKAASHRAIDGEEIVVTGSAGHLVLEDGYGLHKGMPVLEGERLVFWVRYGIYDNGFSQDCGAPILCANLANRYMLEPLFVPVE